MLAKHGLSAMQAVLATENTHRFAMLSRPKKDLYDIHCQNQHANAHYFQ